MAKSGRLKLGDIILRTW